MSTKAQVKTQAKTQVGTAATRIPQDPVPELEHEAERPDIAAQLEAAARLGHSLGAVSVDGPAPPIIQRQEIPEEEEEELQLKREPAAIQRQEIPLAEEEDLQMMPAPAEQVALQRQEIPEEEELLMKRDDQRVGPQGGQVPPEVVAAIRRARGGGQPMEADLQEQMSASLGHDFSGVRVHTDAEADALNQQLQAKAFTTGQDIFFRSGEYAPRSGQGQELIGHELQHVVQQSTGKVSGMTVRPPGDAFEQEADAMAKHASKSSNNPPLQRALANPTTHCPLAQYKEKSKRRPWARKGGVGKMTTSNTTGSIQRLIVGVGGMTLEKDIERDNGWITASTIAVALKRGRHDQRVVEYDAAPKLADDQGPAADEDIYFVGHGQEQLWGKKTPRAVAAATRMKLPQDYKGKIQSLSCSSGYGAVYSSAVGEFARHIGQGVEVRGGKGLTLHHPAIPGEVRTVKKQFAGALKAYLASTARPDWAWRVLVRRLGPIYGGKTYGVKVRGYARASVTPTADLYKRLVEHAQQQHWLHRVGEEYQIVGGEQGSEYPREEGEGGLPKWW